MDFCTLGMFIIDDIYPSPSNPDQTPKKDIVGGAGTYSAIGARLVSPSPASKKVGWIVDAGTGFPSELRSTIASWETGVLIRPRDALTTRGWNGYSDNEHRAFKYLTEKKRLTAEDLTPDLLAAKSFHLICSPLRCIDLVKRILERRREVLGAGVTRPIIIWEPVPDMCIPSELQSTIVALPYVDVISPNHQELGALFGYSYTDSSFPHSTLVSHASKLTQHGIGPRGEGALIARCGKEGCYISSRSQQHLDCWIPPYHSDQAAVVDPTGGGNGFLGGLAVGLVRTDFDVVTAAALGGLAAGFCIEQVGVPVLSMGEDGRGERWNGDSVVERWHGYYERLGLEEHDDGEWFDIVS